MIRAVVFDLDDTLFPEHQFVMSGFRVIDRYMRAQFGVENFFAHAESIFSGGNRGTVFDHALEQLGIDPDPLVITTLVSIYREHFPQIALFDDARWAISFFNKPWKTGIITDGLISTQRNKVRALSIESQMDIIVYTDQYGHTGWKPSLIPYLEVMNTLGCSGQECVYIADNPVKDFVGARKLGWKTVRVCRKDGEYSSLIAGAGYEADFTIASLYELRELIEHHC